MTLSTLDVLQRASQLVYRHMQASPQLNCPLLGERCGCQVWVKHENHNPGAAFKAC